MTIFGYRIERRFWIVLGLVVTILGGMIVFNQLNQPEDPTRTPAFPITDLPQAAQSDGWTDYFLEKEGLLEASSVDDFRNLTENMGKVVRAQVLVPSAEEAGAQTPELLKRDYGWNLIPALYLDPTEPASPESLSERAGNLGGEQLIVLAFPEGESVGTQQGIYEITGLLYGRSDTLKISRVAPVVLVSSFRTLTGDEYSAPMTHIADLDISYRRGNVQTDVQSIEWASGKQVRVCLRFQNFGTAPIIASEQFSGATASYQLASGAQADNATIGFNAESSLEATPIQPGSKGSGGFALFPAPFAAPDQELTLRIPNGLTGSPTILTVTPDQFKTAAAAAQDSPGQAVGGCSA